MRPLSFLATALVASTIAAACGSSSDDAGTQSTGTAGSGGGSAGKAGSSGSSGGSAGKAGSSGSSGATAGGSAGTGGSPAGAGGSGGTATAGSAGANNGGASTAGAAGAATAGAGGTTAAGSGGAVSGGSSGSSSGGTAGSAGTAACPGQVVPPSLPDTCTIDTDCVLGTALSECCGPVAYAVPTAQLSAWNAAAATYNACKCPQKPACVMDGTAAEDKTTPSTPNALAEPVAKCRQGVCVATYESCKALPDVPRACTAPADCESIEVVPACCAREVRGVSKGARAAYEQTLSAYVAACQDCSLVKCPIPAPTADDGTQATSADQKPSVSCQAALCTTSFGK